MADPVITFGRSGGADLLRPAMGMEDYIRKYLAERGISRNQPLEAGTMPAPASLAPRPQPVMQQPPPFDRSRFPQWNPNGGETEEAFNARIRRNWATPPDPSIARFRAMSPNQQRASFSQGGQRFLAALPEFQHLSGFIPMSLNNRGQRMYQAGTGVPEVLPQDPDAFRERILQIRQERAASPAPRPNIFGRSPLQPFLNFVSTV